LGNNDGLVLLLLGIGALYLLKKPRNGVTEILPGIVPPAMPPAITTILMPTTYIYKRNNGAVVPEPDELYGKTRRGWLTASDIKASERLAYEAAKAGVTDF